MFASGMKLVVVVMLALAASAVAKHHHHDFKRPEWCRDLDCPRFRKVDSTGDYVVREYEKSLWVETNVTGMTFQTALPFAMRELYGYLRGGNDKKAHINMTTPVATKMRLNHEGTGTQGNYTVGVYLPWAYQDGDEHVPRPTSRNVAVAEYEGWTAYVKSLSGFATEGSLLDTKQALQQALLEEHEEFEAHWFVSAVYDPPTTLLDRHNEVWVPTAEQHQHAAAAALVA